jgi:hypothetical protein
LNAAECGADATCLAALKLHSFGANPFTTLTTATSTISLKWSDPLAGSGNDYDIFVMNSTSTAILCNAGINNQSGTQDPVEFAFCNPGSFPVGSRIYIVKFAAAAATRALRLDTNRGTITAANATNGSTFGHNAAASALSVASVGYNGGAFLSTTPFTGGTSVHVDFFSYDGPRKMFFPPYPAMPATCFQYRRGCHYQRSTSPHRCGSTDPRGFTPLRHPRRHPRRPPSRGDPSAINATRRIPAPLIQRSTSRQSGRMLIPASAS